MPSVFLDSPPSSIVPYYQMDTPGRSAGATMRTVLESTGVGVTGLPSQAVLMAEGRAASSSGEPQGTWQVDPKGLYAVLRNRRSPGASFFTLESYGLDNPIENPNASIVHGITHFNAACAVLTGAGEHWAVVTGYQTDNAGRLQFFCVHDPEPPLTDPTNPDHIPGTGVPNEIVQALAWNDRRYCRIAIGREWVNRYLLVRVGMSLPFAQSAPQGTFQQQPRADGRNLIAADRAHDVACDCMAELGLTGLADYAAAFARASAAEPVLVQDLSRRGGFYYLLRYQARGGDIAAVAIDARTGVLLSSAVFPKPVTLLNHRKDAIVERVMRYCERARPDARSWLGGVRRDSITLHDRLVWDAVPSAGSLLLPFVPAAVGDERLLVGARDHRVVRWAV